MKSVPTNLEKLDEIIARQYEDKIRGLAKDSVQNSWSAILAMLSNCPTTHSFIPALAGRGISFFGLREGKRPRLPGVSPFLNPGGIGTGFPIILRQKDEE